MRNILKLHSGTQSGTPVSSKKSHNFGKNKFSMGGNYKNKPRKCN